MSVNMQLKWNVRTTESKNKVKSLVYVSDVRVQICYLIEEPVTKIVHLL